MVSRALPDSPSAPRNPLPAWSVLPIGLAVVAALSVVDYVTGSDLSFSIFYLAPVLFVTWYAGRRLGSAVAVVAAAVWGIVDVAAGANYATPVIPVWNASVRLGFFAIALWLLSELKGSNERARALAHTDSLTGVGNARSFYADLEREIERLRRYGRPFALAYADLDHFKEVNDLLGHARGDDLLRRVAEALTESTRYSDIVARLGGDEFALLMPETGADAATLAVDRAREAVAATLRDLASDVPGAGMTVGVAVFTVAPESADAAVAAADVLMYGEKRAGRGTVALAAYPGETELGPRDLGSQAVADEGHADAPGPSDRGLAGSALEGDGDGQPL